MIDNLVWSWNCQLTYKQYSNLIKMTFYFVLNLAQVFNKKLATKCSNIKAITDY